jgi:hypothetical protein
MARKKVEVFIDDLTGETLSENDAVVLSLTVEGKKYDLDTTEANKAKAVRRVLAALNQLPHQQVSKGELVAWINNQGLKYESGAKKGKAIKLSDDLRGRIADDLLEKYDEAL